MAMSQGTSTFLACFAGFWLVWALIVMTCCFCNFVQRRLKHQREERLREQCLRALEMDACHTSGYPPPPPLPREPLQFGPPQTLPPPPTLPPPQNLPPPPSFLPPAPLHVPQAPPEANWVNTPDAELCGKPPCYEEAIMMEDPPPPYSEVLADPRGGTYLKPSRHREPRGLREPQEPTPVLVPETSKSSAVLSERDYSSLIHLPSAHHWDSLDHLLSSMDLNHNTLTPPQPLSVQAVTAVATMPRRETRTRLEMPRLRGGIYGIQGVHGLPGIQSLQRVQGLREFEPSYGLPTAFPLPGRSTAV